MGNVEAIPDIDWSENAQALPSASTLVAVPGLVGIVVAFLYHYLRVPQGDPLLGYPVTRLDWLWLVSCWLFASHILLPAVRSPDTVRSFVEHLARDRTQFVAAAFTTAVFLAGTVGPMVVPQPAVDFVASKQPPMFTSISMAVLSDCLNQVDGRCWGTAAHPLGTMRNGRDILHMLVIGARSTVQLSMVGVMLIVPVGVTMGTVGAYLGGRVDRVLSGLSDAVKGVPALLVFLAWRWMTGDGTVFMLVVSFGLVSWGSVASVVRSRALNEVSKDYIRSAELNGADTFQVIRWHLLPNVGRTALGTAIFQVPLFIIYEAALSYLQYGSPASPLLLMPTTHIAWGEMIGSNLQMFDPFWWMVVMPLAALFATVLSVYVFAGAIQSFFDPRGAD